MGVRGVTDLIVMPGLINLDFADIRTVMSEMGKAMMGTGEGSGERRSLDAAEAAISNPLLDEVSMKGARGVLINITGGPDMTLFEVDEAANRIKEEVDPDANIIVGSTLDESMQGQIRVSVVATGIEVGEARAEAVARPAAERPLPASSHTPGFRLRPQQPKPAAIPFPAKPATATGVERREGDAARPAGEPAPEADRRGNGPSEPGPPAPSGPSGESTGMTADDRGAPATGERRSKALGGRSTEPGLRAPALPPQERFHDWSRLRAPVRETDRAPSLFERVTATFARARPEHPEGEREPELATADAGDRRHASGEEEVLEIPAFLRR
jgi:cell division protein FtsZ